MAQRPLRICRTPCCETLTRETRCPPHAAEHALRRKQRPSPSSRGYGYRWQTLRRQALRRDGNLCRICSSATATEVDHILPRTSFDNPKDADFLGNLQSVCKSCHSRKTMNDTRGLGRWG